MDEKIKFIKEVVISTDRQLLEFISFEIDYSIKSKTGSWEHPLDVLLAGKERKPNKSEQKKKGCRVGS